MVATRTELRATTEAKVKTDDREARTLARLLAAGLLGGCWLPDEQTRALRRRLARRAQLVRQQTRAKNEVHAVLMRTLKGRPPMSDVFGRGGRVWLAELELPVDERETVDGCLRQIEREPVWRPAGTGIYLPGNATRALRARPRGAGCVPVRRNPAAALLRSPWPAAVRGSPSQSFDERVSFGHRMTRGWTHPRVGGQTSV